MPKPKKEYKKTEFTKWHAWSIYVTLGLSLFIFFSIITIIVLSSIEVANLSSQVNSLLGGNSIGSLNIEQLIAKPIKGVMHSEDLRSALKQIIPLDEINSMISSNMETIAQRLPDINQLINNAMQEGLHQLENYIQNIRQVLEQGIPQIESYLNIKFTDLEHKNEEVKTKIVQIDNNVIEMKQIIIDLITEQINKTRSEKKSTSRQLFFVEEGRTQPEEYCGGLSFCNNLNACATGKNYESCRSIIERVLCECGWS